MEEIHVMFAKEIGQGTCLKGGEFYDGQFRLDMNYMSDLMLHGNGKIGKEKEI